METKKEQLKYSQYHDFIFKRTVEKYANGILKFLNIPYEIQNVISSEITDFGPQIHRLDFVCEVKKGNKEITLIIECQSKLPNEDDIKRFFQYVSTFRIFKNRNVELYILCTEKAPYETKEFKINDECIYTMKVISLKNFKAREILKSIENKIDNNEEVSSKDLACLQLIAYTDYSEKTLDILNDEYDLVQRLEIEGNEREAIVYIFEILSANMLDKTDRTKFQERTNMMINPRDEYNRNIGKEEGKIEGKKEGKLEVAKNLLKEGMTIEKISKITGLTEQQIENNL